MRNLHGSIVVKRELSGKTELSIHWWIKVPTLTCGHEHRVQAACLLFSVTFLSSRTHTLTCAEMHLKLRLSVSSGISAKGEEWKDPCVSAHSTQTAAIQAVSDHLFTSHSQCVCVRADWEEAEKLFHTHSVAIQSKPWAFFPLCTSSASGLCKWTQLNLSSSSSSNSSVCFSSLLSISLLKTPLHLTTVFTLSCLLCLISS